MTDEQIIELAQTHFEEEFVEYDELNNEVINFITSKENLLQFAKAIYEGGYDDAKSRYATVYPLEVLDVINKINEK